MVQQVLEHQETLQQKLLEAIEKRDDERLKREESWKRQEMARLNRQTEQRAQEHAIQSSREKAIISFLNKFTGENFKLDPQVMAKSTALNVQEDEKCIDVRESSDPRCKRWPKSEVYALIQLRSEMEQRFKESGPKVTLWKKSHHQWESWVSIEVQRDAKKNGRISTNTSGKPKVALKRDH